jgi:nucleotide-binding universal stress UspA family protein
MSIFPTKILLATDGSEEAELARKAAVDEANSTNSELNVVTVGPWNPDPAYATHEASFRWETLRLAPAERWNGHRGGLPTRVGRGHPKQGPRGHPSLPVPNLLTPGRNEAWKPRTPAASPTSTLPE